MGGVDKLLVPLGDRPLLAWSIDALSAARAVRRTFLVVAPDRLEALGRAEWLSERDVTLVAGGEKRQQSVSAGLRAATASVVLVHDGARPFVSSSLVDRVAEAAARWSAAVPTLPVTDSLKRVVDGRISGAVSREGLHRSQTPQGFELALLRRAFAALGDRELWTDEASLVEAYGQPVAIVPGEERNLKVTVPEDLAIANALVEARAGRTAHGTSEGHRRAIPAAGAIQRIGWGSDSHPFGPDDGLALGGLLIEEAPRLHGHSDGDVVLHAIADALLASAGLPDLGRRFPAGDPHTHGIDSRALLSDALEAVRGAGWRPATLQVRMTAARPRLGAARLDAIRDSIAGLLRLDQGDVSVSASTGNLSGPTGAGLAISATALVTTTPSTP